MKKKTKIHNGGFLISPTTHLFPLSGQSGSREVSIKITLKPQIWNMEMIINQSILPCRLELCKIAKKKGTKRKKKKTQTQIPPGGMVNRLERAYSKGPFIFISSDLQYQKIKIDTLSSLLSGIQRLTTSL